MIKPTPNGCSTLEQIEAELDARLLEVWLQAWEIEGWDLEVVGPLLRLAYSMGYQDALIEPCRGTLYNTLGLSVPAMHRD
jgi:hypothetical protein